MQWPPLRYADWADTCETLHMWTQIAGKIRMEKTPPINHWWHVALYVTSCGLTTSPIPDGDRTFDFQFDFHSHRLMIATSDGEHRQLALEPITVADFYSRLMRCLGELKIEVSINTLPSEVANPIHFDEDRMHKSYDAEAAHRFWQALVSSDRVLKEFRSRFIGKVR